MAALCRDFSLEVLPSATSMPMANPNGNVASARLTVSRVQGHGGERETVETYRGTSVKMGLTEKVMLDIGVSEDFVDRTVSALKDAARTGGVGDGKIFVLPVEAVHRIRTGERDQAAVTPVAT